MEEKLIYVVDDEKDIREMEKTFLENEGYRVEIFSDADEVLRKMGIPLSGDSGKGLYMGVMRGEKPDLVIMDIMMPGTNGLTACSRIRKANDSVLSALPVILVSAKDTPLDRVTGLTMGSDDYLIKPFLPLELVARVKALLRRSEILREQISCDFGKSGLIGGDSGLFSTEQMGNINGVKNQHDCAEHEEKCGNLVLNYAARRGYVIEPGRTPRKMAEQKKFHVDKNTGNTGNKEDIEALKISEKVNEEICAAVEENINAKTGKNPNGIKKDSLNQKTASRNKENAEFKGIELMEVQVTPMEFDFLYFLMLRKETAVSKAELLKSIWHLPDAELREDVRMTDDLLKRLRKKLRAAGSSARVETVWGFGYRLTEN